MNVDDSISYEFLEKSFIFPSSSLSPTIQKNDRMLSGKTCNPLKNLNCSTIEYAGWLYVILNYC